MPRCRTEDPEEGLAEISQWIAIRVHVQVNLPNVIAGNKGHEAESGVKSYAGSVASIRECPSRIKVSLNCPVIGTLKISDSYGADWGPSISVVIKKNIEP